MKCPDCGRLRHSGPCEPSKTEAYADLLALLDQKPASHRNAQDCAAISAAEVVCAKADLLETIRHER